MAEKGTQKGKRTCPVCDEPVSEEDTVCPSCNTDLSLFAAEEMDTAEGDAETLKSQIMADGNGHISDLLQAADEDILPAPAPPAAETEESFECPECNGLVPGDANVCPHCGVEFEMEEVFECPMCGSLIDANVDKCPSCGAEFEEETHEPVDISSSIVEEEPPKSTGPVSFAERLKQVKDDPASAPPKPAEQARELSFAERMKAMKDGALTETKPEPVPASTDAKTAPVKPEIKKPAPEKTAAVEHGGPVKPASPPAPDKTAAAVSESYETKISKPKPDPAVSRKENYKELPRYIGEVKKLLILANEMKIDISASKALINEAVTAGKKRDLDNAIALVKKGKAGLERDLRSSMVNKLRTLQNAVKLEKKSGRDVSAPEAIITGISKSMDAGDFHSASAEMKKLESQMASTVGASLPKAELEVIEKTLVDAAALKINVNEAKSLFDEAKMAIDLDDNAKASEMAKRAGESLTRVLPGYIASEMRKAKITLREIKMMNVDITQPVNILKEANNFVRDGDYCGALGSIKEFKDFVSRSKE